MKLNNWLAGVLCSLPFLAALDFLTWSPLLKQNLTPLNTLNETMIDLKETLFWFTLSGPRLIRTQVKFLGFRLALPQTQDLV